MKMTLVYRTIAQSLYSDIYTLLLEFMEVTTTSILSYTNSVRASEASTTTSMLFDYNFYTSFILVLS